MPDWRKSRIRNKVSHVSNIHDDDVHLPAAAGRGPRWWQTLAFRLGLVVNLAAIAVLGGFWLLDTRREWATHVNQETERLREEARVLAAARAYFSTDAEFAEFVGAFCRQMQVSVSPEHHILVLNGRNEVIARGHARAGAALESTLLHRPRLASDQFGLEGRRYASVAVSASDGGNIVMAQSLATVSEIIRAQARSRAWSLALLSTLVFGCTSLALLGWVRDPLQALVRGVRAIGQRSFQTRIPPTGSAELRYLASGFNDMAAALQAVDRQRQAQMRRARDIQMRLLPDTLDGCGAYEITAFFEPAESVGGDLYDVSPLANGSTLVAVLDVSGHGVASALYTALLRTVLRHEARLHGDVGRILEAMNREMVGVAAGSGDFATCFLCRIDEGSKTVCYASAGHDPAVLIRPGASSMTLGEHGLPLGVLPDATYVTCSGELSAGARLFLYTDGLHEVAGPDGRLFGRERLLQTLAQTGDREPAEQTTAVIHAIRDYAAGAPFMDDVTLVCIRARVSR